MIFKRFLSFVLFLMIFFMQVPAFSAPQKKTTYQKRRTVYKKTAVKKKINKKTEKPEFYIPPVPDPAADALVGKGYVKKRYNEKLIEDNDVNLLFKTSASKYDYKTVEEKDEPPVCDVCADIKPAHKPIQIPENESVVYLKPMKKVSTRCKRVNVGFGEKNKKYSLPFPLIGETVKFKVQNDVTKNGKTIISKGSVVYASVGEVSPRGMGGVPAEMTLEKFYLTGSAGKIVELDGEINSSGYTLAVWIGLVELATTPFLFGLAAPALRVLPGGQAVVTPRKKYAVYYRM